MATKLINSAAVRSHLQQALEADLIGPFVSDGSPEVLEIPPTRWYLTGFLVPEGGLQIQKDPTEQDELGSDNGTSDEENPSPEPPATAKRKGRLPASIGLSVFLPSGSPDECVIATVNYADYRPIEDNSSKETSNTNISSSSSAADCGKKTVCWERIQRDPVSVSVQLNAEILKRGIPIPQSNGLVLVGQISDAQAGTSGLTEDARALALFLVNRRETITGPLADQQAVFQVSLAVSFERGLVGRQNIRGEDASDWDERLADLQFRDRLEYAVGHGVSVKVESDSSGRICSVRTCWIPDVIVPIVRTRDPGKTIVSMEALAELKDSNAIHAALDSLVADYSAWISAQRCRQVSLVSSENREKMRNEVMDRASRACERIKVGISLLERDEQVREAFCLANRAMAMTARKRKPKDEPKWRLFQLAFLLLNLESISNENHPDRECVELIFFPTGGGKTEAYLGVIAFLLIWRRLRGQTKADCGLGVAVILRYTLRLLTLDQLGRAAGLICALEMIRHRENQETPDKLGKIRFSIGLWVGQSATANRFKEVVEKLAEYERYGPPCRLTQCPWCGKEFNQNSFQIHPNRKAPIAVIVGCSDFQCEFSPGNNPEGLPLLFVDEQIYRELPSFIIATVDKFALLPWRGETGLLFGRAEARVESKIGVQFLGPEAAIPRDAVRLPEGLRPPELIIQDELHLISGPLGTMVGLYEVAIETLASRPGINGKTGKTGKTLKPKVIASTATVRRASEQVRSLFGRSELAIFPPPGVDDSETFFAEVEKEGNGRLYVGVAAPGRALKAVLLRTYIALLGASQHAYERDRLTGDNAADPYMTLTGYFNSLRELGGMRRLVEDEIRTRAAKVGDRKPISLKSRSSWFANRDIDIIRGLAELTSRESITAISETKAKIAKKYADRDHVDVLLASNMISVGIDIDRLGLMVVAGQPKSTSEYIQASSRVGRKREWPGLVVTVLNPNRPRDRSHYERFCVYHQSFYRFVEATSVTPFSGPALERGLAAVLVAMTRLGHPEMTPPLAVMRISEFQPLAQEALQRIAERAAMVGGGNSEEQARRQEAVRLQGLAILNAWTALMEESRNEAGAVRRYSPFETQAKGKPLLKDPLSLADERGSENELKFSAPTSMRDVERVVSVWLETKKRKVESHGG